MLTLLYFKSMHRQLAQDEKTLKLSHFNRSLFSKPDHMLRSALESTFNTLDYHQGPQAG